MKKEPECKDGDHQFKSVSNNWFNWNTGEVMCIGECVKCGIRKEIEYSKVRKSVVIKRGKRIMDKLENKAILFPLFVVFFLFYSLYIWLKRDD